MLCAAAALALVATGAPAQEKASQRLRGGSGPVEVVAGSGDVRVRGWDRDEIQVAGDFPRGAVPVSTQGSGAVVRITSSRHGSENAEVWVPRGRDVVVTASSGSVQVTDVSGAVQVRTASGDVQVSGRPRGVEIATRNGDVDLSVTTERVHVSSQSGDVQVRGAFRRGVEISAVNGEISISGATPEVRASTMSGSISVERVSGRAEIRTVSGDIQVEGTRLRGSFNTVSGDISLRGTLDPSETTEIVAHNGDVTLSVGSRPGADVQVTTVAGNVDPGGGRVLRTSRTEQHVRIGNGGARVVVRTFSGDVRLEE
jgi:DUF4097 and DUF4098 domain-containing protein YvlB